MAAVPASRPPGWCARPAGKLVQVSVCHQRVKPRCGRRGDCRPPEGPWPDTARTAPPSPAGMPDTPKCNGVPRHPTVSRDITRELARRLELLTCCLQDSCATDCATPAVPGQRIQPTFRPAASALDSRPRPLVRRSRDHRRMPSRGRSVQRPRQPSAAPIHRVPDRVLLWPRRP